MTTNSALSTMDRLGIVFLRWRRFLQSQFVPHAISLQQAFVLRRLEERAGLAPSTIARLLFCDRPTATVVIRNMEKQGWVTQEPDPDDGRRRRVLVTPVGRTKLTELNQTVWLPMEARLDPLGCLDEQERRELDRLLTKVQAHVMAITREEKDEHGQ